MTCATSSAETGWNTDSNGSVNPARNFKKPEQNSRLVEVELCSQPNFYKIAFRVCPRY